MAYFVCSMFWFMFNRVSQSFYLSTSSSSWSCRNTSAFDSSCNFLFFSFASVANELSSVASLSASLCFFWSSLLLSSSFSLSCDISCLFLFYDPFIFLIFLCKLFLHVMAFYNSLHSSLFYFCSFAEFSQGINSPLLLLFVIFHFPLLLFLPSFFFLCIYFFTVHISYFTFPCLSFSNFITDVFHTKHLSSWNMFMGLNPQWWLTMSPF